MTILFIAMVIPAVITALWYGGTVLFLSGGLRRLPGPGTPANERFSVVIAARNEASTICACLDSLVAQTIAADRYEIIIVNDRSTDNTEALVNGYIGRFPNIRQLVVTQTPDGLSPKKYAVAQGVAVARNEIIVFTDADCRVPPAWLETIDRHFTAATGLVQGITSYRYIDGMNRLFFKLQELDFISHGIVAAAAIGAGLPINSNANNFAFRREAFMQAGGLTETIGHIVSGDDDLLLQKIWKLRTWNITYMTAPEGAVETMPTMTPSALLQQRARWGSKTVHYNRRQMVLLSGIFLFYTVIFLSILLAWVDSRLLPTAVTLLLIKYAGESLLMVPGLRRFHHTELLPLLPVASILQLPLVLAAIVLGLFGKFMWKDQTFSRTIKQHQKKHTPPRPSPPESL